MANYLQKQVETIERRLEELEARLSKVRSLPAVSTVQSLGSTSGTAGYLAYFATSTALGGTGIYYDATNQRYGYGTASPLSTVDTYTSATNDDPAYYARSAAIAHGMTDYAPTTAYFQVLNYSAGSSRAMAGALIRGFSAANNVPGVQIDSYGGGASYTVGTATVFNTGKKSGTAAGAIGDAELAYVFQNAATTKITIYGSGALSTVSTLTGTRLISTIATGTAPLGVTSTTLNTNLNADAVDSLHASAAVSATSPITITANTYMLHATGGTAITIAHATTAGNIHLPTGGSANQVLKNSGTSGTGAWGTVTESSGALASVTSIGMSGQLTSSLATGTAPFSIASTTNVSNLSVDMVDGAHVGTCYDTKLMRFNATGTKMESGTVTESSGALGSITTISMSGQLNSTLATGTAPFSIASTTLVSNLNAEHWAGYHAGSWTNTSLLKYNSTGTIVEPALITDNGTIVTVNTACIFNTSGMYVGANAATSAIPLYLTKTAECQVAFKSETATSETHLMLINSATAYMELNKRGATSAGTTLGITHAGCASIITNSESLIIGCTTDKPIIFGSNNVEACRINQYGMYIGATVAAGANPLYITAAVEATGVLKSTLATDAAAWQAENDNGQYCYMLSGGSAWTQTLETLTLVNRGLLFCNSTEGLVICSNTGGSVQQPIIFATRETDGANTMNTMYFVGNNPRATLNAAYENDSDSFGLYLNYTGYRGGVTRFRDTYICNGKGTDIFVVDGSASTVGINGGLHVGTVPGVVGDNNLIVDGISLFGDYNGTYPPTHLVTLYKAAATTKLSMQCDLNQSCSILFGLPAYPESAGYITFTQATSGMSMPNLTVAGAFGCNGAAAQPVYVSSGPVAPGAGTYGASSGANWSAFVTLVQEIRAALIANGIFQ